MSHTLAELAELVGGVVHGDPHAAVSRAMPLALAQAGDITLLDSSDKSRKQLATSTATAVIVGQASPNRDAIPVSWSVIEVADIHAAFTTIVRLFRPARSLPRVGISPHAHVSPTARIADDVDIHAGATVADDVEIASGTTIYPGVFIGPGCRIGRDVTIFPNAVLYENVIIGECTIVHAAVILGAYGFGYKQVAGRHVLAQQLGYVEIGADVEIGAGTTIDRGTYGPTVIGEGTKIDDQVMIGHNCRIGRHNLICSQVGLAGSTSTGDYVVMAGQVGVRDHLHIGDRAVLSAKAGIMYDVDPDTSMAGIPAHPMKEWKLQQVVIAKLPDLRHELKQLERAVSELRERMTSAEVQSREPSTNDERHAA